MKYITARDLALARNRLGEKVPIPPKRTQDHEESRIQQNLIRWWSIACRAQNIPEPMFFAIPNGGWRSPVTGAILKREGARSGVPDLMLAVARGKYHGLFLELKKPDGKPSEAQDLFITRLREQGYMAGVAYGFDDALRFIEAYLRGEEFL